MSPPSGSLQAFAPSLPLPIPSLRPKPTMTRPPPSATASTPSQTSFDPSINIRPALKTMSAYTPIVPYDVLASRLNLRPDQIVKLDANENSYGPSPLAVEAMASLDYPHIYPDPECGALRDALVSYTGLPREYLLAGAGADELIDLLFRLFVTPGAGDSVVNFPPTFGMYKFDADVNGADVISIPRGPDFGVDIAAVEKLFAETGEAARPKMLFVASPNNPDGSTLSDGELKRLLALPTLVVLDEAYFEFADDDRIAWVPRYDNLVVLRTFSKWAGLAGLRVGYGAFPLRIIEHLWKIKQPYNVGVASQEAATVSILDKEDLLGKVARLRSQRVRFYEEIKELDWITPFPSQSNFVLCRIGSGRNAADIKDKLYNQGILIRYYTSPGIDDCIRISMGTDEQMEIVYKALREL